MTKKDYVALAGAIHSARESAFAALGNADDRAAIGVIGIITSRLADAMAQDSPRFDRARFLAACETGSDARKAGR